MVTLPRFYAPDLVAPARAAVLSGEEARHLARVLRLGIGARVSIFNGAGEEWLGRVAAIGRSSATIDLVDRVAPAPEPPVRVTLGIGLLKGDQMDHVVRDATMLGVHAIAPIASAHVAVPHRAWRSGAAVERWRKVAVASAKQCGRAVVPGIRPVASLDAVLAASSAELIVMTLEPSAPDLPDVDRVGPPHSALALVGPEGGWSADEVEQAAVRGARAIRLGPRVLRAEAAPAVLLSSLWTRWGW